MVIGVMRIPWSALIWIGLFFITLFLANYGKSLADAISMNWLVKYPKAWVFPLKDYVSSAMQWLVEDATFGVFTFTEATRGLSWVIEQPYNFARALLSGGFERGLGKSAVQILPPLSWLTVIAAVIALGHYAKDWVLAAILVCHLVIWRFLASGTAQ